MIGLQRIRRSGFTLIELMAGMVVLGIIVVLIGRIFADSSIAYRQGIKRAENNSSGRAVLELIARDLSHAVVDDILKMNVEQDNGPSMAGGDKSDRIHFTALSNEERYRGGKAYRAAEQIVYYMHRSDGIYNLRRSIRRNADWVSNHAYSGSPDVPMDRNRKSDHVVAENVRTFKVFVYDRDGKELTGVFDGSNPPLYADLYLELLGANDAEKVENTGDAGFCARVAKRYATRVFFHHQAGYSR